jgi:hypothetical protein
LLYWGFDDVLATAILVFSALSVYLAWDITRVFEGSPRAWDLFIAAFVALFAYRAVELYFDLQSPSGIIDDWEASVALVAGVLLFGALLLLDLTFRRHREALRPAR